MTLRSDLSKSLQDVVVTGHDQNDLGWTAHASSLCREATRLISNAIRNGDSIDIDRSCEGMTTVSLLGGRVRCIDARESGGMVRLQMDETVPQGEEDAGQIRTVLELRWPNPIYGPGLAVESADDMHAVFLAAADVCHRAWCVPRNEPLRPFLSMIGAMDADMILHAATPWSTPIVEDLGDDPAAMDRLDRVLLRIVASRMPSALSPIVMRKEHLYKIIIVAMEIPMRRIGADDQIDPMRMMRDVLTASARPILRRPLIGIGRGEDRILDLQENREEDDDAV